MSVLMEARRGLKESTALQGVIPIEEYLDRLDPHRSTTLTWPYPLNNTPAPSETATKIEPYHDRILNILHTHNFPPRQYLRFSVFSTTKPQYPSYPPKTTLSLQYITDPYSSKSPKPPPLSTLDTARSEISSLLSTNNIRGIEVELVFLNQCFDPCLFSIKDDTPEWKLFESTRRIIHSRVVSTLRGDWRMMKLFNLGMTKEEALPTIVIQVSPFTSADWGKMTRQIRGLVEDANANLPAGDKLGGGIDVEFIPGNPRREIMYEDDEDLDLDKAFEEFDEVFPEALDAQQRDLDLYRGDDAPIKRVKRLVELDRVKL
ncbi:hypothetical protein BDV18DRAFT_157585 [Aspergillus unguis]